MNNTRLTIISDIVLKFCTGASDISFDFDENPKYNFYEGYLTGLSDAES
ncbi:MAG: hypothetical protein ACRDGA_09530 [Bacteroidota bacterium]